MKATEYSGTAKAAIFNSAQARTSSNTMFFFFVTPLCSEALVKSPDSRVEFVMEKVALGKVTF